MVAVIDTSIYRRAAMAEEGTPPTEAGLRAELRQMKVSALKRRARESGVADLELDEADDADDVRSKVVELIVEAEQGAPLARLRSELENLRPSALRQRARELGVDVEQGEPDALVDLILAKMRQAATYLLILQACAADRT
eukprot:COSAG04_NODE_2957_length_3348_cov_3.757772_5_plen_140_part_00